ncbi:MAG: hypothetical protein PHQ14_10655 [Chromatiales bacterium]|nr:hypothetical protein [Chromatiales bacterium]
MSDFILEPTATAQWQRLVREAAGAATQELDEQLESYLVFVLLRFSQDISAGHRVLALDYMQGLLAQGHERADRLREVGDHCLLFAGLFPQRARRRRVSVGYYVDLGRSAYARLSDLLSRTTAELFGELSRAFVPLTDVLRAMRELDGSLALSPLEAMDLWTDTGSRQARTTLSRYGSGRCMPVRGNDTRQ